MTYDNKHELSRIADLNKIEELLFNSEHIMSRAIADNTGIHYQSIAKWRNGERNYRAMNIDFAVDLTNFYDKYNQK